LSSVGNNWMDAPDSGFPSLTSIDFSGLGSLSNVGENWMVGNTSNPSFSNMNSIYVGGINFKSGFSKSNFCSSWPANGTIYADDIATIGPSWLVGGISTWNVVSSPTLSYIK